LKEKIKMIKKLSILLLVLAILLPACAGNDNPKTNETKSETSEVDETVTTQVQPDIPKDVNFGGETFTFLVTGPNYGYGYYETIDIFTEAQNGETLNDAVYMRNRTVEERLNIEIAEFKAESVVNTATKSITAGDDEYDVIFTLMQESATLAQKKMIMNLKEVPYIDLDKPWWDKNAEIDLSIKNKLYFTTGDISTMAKACTRLFVFNKKLMKEYDLGDPYENVKNDTWTLDVFSKMVKSLYVDVNGNGEKDDEDIYGTIMEAHNPMYLLTGFGEKLTTNDANGYPQITCTNDRFYTAADKLWDLYFDDTVCRDVSKMKTTSEFSNVYTYARALFTRDKFLFHLPGALVFYEFRDMESDFGVLPCPKFDESQPRYYHIVEIYSVMLSVPVTTDLERAGIVLESMAAESMYTITPAFNETMLKRKYVRDNESEFILDIINATHTYDLCMVFNWGGMFGIVNSLTANKNRNLASEMAKVYEKALKEIENTVNTFE